MKVLFYLLLITTMLSCDESSTDVYPSTPTHEETKLTLEEQEKADPSEFVTATGGYRKNLIGEWVLIGKINNKATVATYKDAVLKITYYSKTKTALGSEEKTISEFFKPNSSQDFKIKTAGVDGTAFIDFGVISASNVE